MSKPRKPTYTRRDVQRMKPDILGHYHELVMTNDFAGYEKLLDEYRIPAEEREQLLKDFKHAVERVVRQHWRSPKSR